jgi:hypothetical protein
LVQNLQQKNIELESQVSSLKSKLLTIEKQSSVNNWSQYDRNLNELQRLTAELADRDFEILQLRKEVYEVNNQYSEYYILKEDNETMRHKVSNLVEIIETLKRSGIHNSFQKEELIIENQYLTDQLDRSRLYHT